MYKMSGKMAAVGSKLEQAARTQEMSLQLKNSVPSLKNCLKQMEKSGVNANMGEFEKVFENLDVQVAGMGGMLDNIGGVQDNQAVTDLLT